MAALALTASPGPDMLLIASRSAAQGRAAGLSTWAGSAAGTYLHALAAALGLSQLFLAVPMAYDAVRYIGAAYLLYLAWTSIRGQQGPDVPFERTQKIRTAKTMFVQGLVTNVLNPKMVAFVLALFPQFVTIGSGPVVVQIMILATILNVVGFFVNGAVILAAGRVQTILKGDTRFKKLPQYFLGAAFAGLAFRWAFGAPD